MALLKYGRISWIRGCVNRLRRVDRVLFCAWLSLALGGAAQDELGGDPLGAADEAIRLNDFDGAIAILDPVLADREIDIETRRACFLLMIKAYVTGSNYFSVRTQGRATSELLFQRAEELVVECLNEPSLRETRPEPAILYPERMLRLFDDVHRRLFGSLRIKWLEPTSMEIRFGDEPLAAGDSTTVILDDVPVGRHVLLARAAGYEDWVREIEIEPGATVDLEVTLEREPGLWTKVLRIGAPVAAVVAAVVLIFGGDDSPDPVDPIGDPPELPD